MLASLLQIGEPDVSFWTIAFGIAQLVVILVGGAGFFLAMRYDIRLLRHDFRGLEQRQTALDKKIEGLDRKIDDERDANRREHGEVVIAIRQKVTDDAMFVRDNFVRKETFGPVLARLEGDVKTVGDRIEARLLRMEAKIDTKT